ncbi:MAG TPA: transporter substrate-binding domain-containing protein [Spirochaetota bacterium]|nr:transporter substrate-binding domain-containing protein [Spirochaetota bacterium]HPJ42803.1 transporter substrate-binding domain-containing protein [Spirochaetota bacterium]HPR38533.1 transporter substrate-binding domain-containing protein [Spirochaetota bacterium]
MNLINNIIIPILLILFLSIDCKAKDIITIVYGSQYKPFSWGGDDLVAHGVQRDFVEEILVNRLGLTIKHEAYPWKRCQIYVENGEKDGFFTVTTNERKKFTITSSIPFYKTYFVMHTGKNNPNIALLNTVTSITDLEKMQNLKHIYMRASGWHKENLKRMKNVYEITDSSTIPLMLKMLRYDLYIEQEEMFRYQAKNMGVLEDVVTLDKPILNVAAWHIFISKKSRYQSIIPRINSMLLKLQKSGELEKIRIKIFRKNGIE